MRSRAVCAVVVAMLAAPVVRASHAEPLVERAVRVAQRRENTLRHDLAVDRPRCRQDLVRAPGGCALPPVSTGRRTLAVLAATIPGFLVRGTGSYVTHNPRTAKRLLLVGGIGLGLAVVGGVPVGVSGGNPYLLWPFVPMLVSGAGMFVQSWLADIYVAAGGSEGTPRALTPYSLELGTIWLHDAYRDRAIGKAGARVAYGRADVAAAGYASSDQTYYGGDLGVAVRLLGALGPTGELVTDGGYLDIRTTARLRDDLTDRVQVATIEAEVVGRLDLQALSESLANSFAELSTGGGIERAAFATEDEIGGLLLGRFAWGMYLVRRGEAQLFYDHRRDSFAGGIAAYRAAGFVGSVGARADVRITGRLALHAELEIGSAWVTSLGVRYQGGPP